MVKEYDSYDEVPIEARGLDILLAHCYKIPKTDRLDYRPKKSTYLDKHPFNLNVGTDSSSFTLSFIGDPGYTESSVDGFLTSVALAFISSPYLQQIRIIKVKESTQNDKKHDIFFEIRIADRIFICGGCNDYSGAGKSGTYRINTVVATLNKLFHMEAEEVVIEHSKGQKMIKELESYIYKYHNDLL